jgi:hypothetical protein
MHLSCYFIKINENPGIHSSFINILSNLLKDAPGTVFLLFFYTSHVGCIPALYFIGLFTEIFPG